MLFNSVLVLSASLATCALAVSNAATSLTLLYQNNLNASDDRNHASFLLLDSNNRAGAISACAALNETLLPSSIINAHRSDIQQSLAYVASTRKAFSNQLYHVQDGLLEGYGTFTIRTLALGARVPVLCSQSSTSSQPSSSSASANNQVSIASGGNTYVGYRNQKSFRFLGIPYANAPQRFVHSSLYTPKGQTIQATKYGAQCAQGGSGSEDCLFVNIQTPFIPRQGATDELRPVMFWIHGGGFTGGSGADSGSDGGNLASREDIVVVNINYRLSTLGFLAIPGTNVTGNYGIGDQVTALEWTIQNIASFGGDPKKITIIGESAGAGSVRTLLGSPKAIGKYQGAVAMSNLGGGVALGVNGDYATTYSSYLSISASYTTAGQQIFQSAGCTQSSIEAQIACLKAVPALQVVSYPTVARYVVQDGTYVNTPNLDLVTKNGSAAYVPVIFGIVDNDGASFSTYPKTPVTTELAGIQASLGISASNAQSIIDSKLFPYYDTGNITLDSFNVSQRVATDLQFRCVDQATVYAASQSHVFPKSYFYQMQRSTGGYDPNNLGGPPKSAQYPNGNPNLPYFKLHGADMPWVFGNLGTLRDSNDLYSIQLTSGYFAAFIKTGDPNPEDRYLKIRGYERSLEAIAATGPWEQVGGAEGKIKLLDYPSRTAGFVDVQQCAWLGYGLDYYLKGGA